MNPALELPAITGAPPAQAAVARQIACNAGLNLNRADALLLAQQQRRLRPNEQAELDQMNARLSEALLQVKTSRAPTSAAPVHPARLSPLLDSLSADIASRADHRAAGQLRREAAAGGDLRYSNDLAGAARQGLERRAKGRAAEAAAGNPLYRNTSSKGATR